MTPELMAALMGMHRCAADCACDACGWIGTGREKFYSAEKGRLCEVCLPAALDAHMDAQKHADALVEAVQHEATTKTPCVVTHGRAA